ncbi:unnamed protein product [Clonostachys byssicola]|uniref:Uncharacterized protein n=1 Tax=Clonostachys byssicola TaxID=160290 RepID=A0A9N9XSM7_9HYPO|nr:unnamed protein product [Clonostachys byssicola]
MDENLKKLPGFHPLPTRPVTPNPHTANASPTPEPAFTINSLTPDPMHRHSSIHHLPSSPPPPPPPSGLCTTPSADHSGRFPITQSTAAAAFPTSHEGDLAMGGYSLPPFSTLGSQAHRSSSGMVSITIGTWAPQPHHVAFSVYIVVSR